MEASPVSSVTTLNNTSTSSRNGVVPALAVMLLLAAVVATYLQRPPAPVAFTYVADIDFWQRTPRERLVTATAHFDLQHNLEDIPLQLGDWVGESRPETNKEVAILLDPEQYVQRLYRNSNGQYVWLSMIGGRSSQPFHPPDICYQTDNWLFNFGSHAVALHNGGDIYGYYLEAEKPHADGKQTIEHIVYYFFLFPNQERRYSDGIVLFKLTSGRYGTLEETLAVQADFVRQFFMKAT